LLDKTFESSTVDGVRLLQKVDWNVLKMAMKIFPVAIRDQRMRQFWLAAESKKNSSFRPVHIGGGVACLYLSRQNPPHCGFWNTWG
jgi:hypothetical protein